MESKIKTVADAFAYTGRDITVLLESFKGLPEQDVEYTTESYKRMVVIEALNKEANGGENWKPDWSNSNEHKYFSWVWLKKNKENSGFVVVDTNYNYYCTYTNVGSRLCFLSAELVEYFNAQFPELLQKTLAE